MTTNEIDRRNFSATELRNADSWDAITQLMAEKFGGLRDAADAIGDGFELLEGEAGKNRLVGVSLAFVEWTFSEGDFGPFVTARVVAQMRNGDMSKFIINDGSSGIYAQLLEFSQNTGGLNGGLIVQNGLRRSDYTYTDPDTGKPVPATTFYIDTSRTMR